MTLQLEQATGVDKRIKDVIFIIYLLLIVEGALRKWVLPQFSSALFFIKEPFILYVYWQSFVYRRMPGSGLFYVMIIFCILFFLLMCFQTFFFTYDIIIGLYGWRNYCLYMPLAFIIGKQFQEVDIIRIAKTTCWLAIPISILAYIQYKSPMDSFINTNVGGSTAEIFTVAAGVVRPSATFSFTTGFVLFLTVYFVFLLYNFFLDKKLFLNRPIFIISVFSFFTCLAVSGSRGAYFSIGLIMTFVVLASVFLVKQKRGFLIIIYSLMFAILAAIMFTFVFTDQWDTIQQRQLIAHSAEGSILNRLLTAFINLDFLVYGNITMLGAGIGLGSGGGAYLATGTASFVLAETEWARHLLEAGFFMGSIYIFLRAYTCFRIFKDAVIGLSLTGSPVPLIFAGFLIPNMLVGAITGNGASYSFTWIFLGFSLAINKIYIKKGQKKRPMTPIVPKAILVSS